MADYDLSQLSSRSFEHLIQALAVKVLGPGVGIFGDGPDGAREATFDGRVPYPSTAEKWDGYGVVQAKFRQRSGNATQDGDWAVAQLKSELNKYLDIDNKLRKPDYFIYVTNLVLTPVKEKGSKDRAQAVLEDFKNRLPLKGYDIWDYDKIRVFLDNNQEVRQAYTAWITPGDALSVILERLTPKTPDFKATLYSFLQKELLSDECVNLEQAGHDVNERISLAKVFVDLPTIDERHGAEALESSDNPQYLFAESEPDFAGRGFIKDMLTVSAEHLDPKTLAIRAIGQSPETRAPEQTRGRFVLIGGPGQGKTTVGQFICQILRASIISRGPQGPLSAETGQSLSLIRQHCEEEGISSSLVPRFPFRIILNEFASALSSDAFPHINSVFSFLAHQIYRRTDRETPTEELHEWFAQYPTLIIFDGLDEVPSSSNRDQVLESIRDFWIDASSLNADILSIATSRPQGYHDEFSPTFYQHQRLAPLSKELGQHFARRLADVRYGSDMDRKERVLARLDRSFENEATSRLMRSPLQVTIMTALVDRMGQPPQARWNLFKAYYDVIYQREVERDIPASSILRLYQPDINAIHNRVGLLLQVDSEQSGRTDAKFSKERFISLVTERLREEGHGGDDLRDLTQQIADAATERLVFLVGLESDRVGFEIRSLQEFMADESLMEGNDEEVRLRLQEIAPLPNWRNVFLFASGKCFSERQHLRETVHTICAVSNEKDADQVAGSYLAGSGLAMDLLDDGLSRHQPKFVHSLARIAIRALDVPNDSFHMQLSNIYEPQLQQVYSEELARRLEDGRETIRLGAWTCLIRLVAGEVQWAREMAEKHWPSEARVQMDILGESVGFWRNSWTATKLLQLMPMFSVTRLRDLFHVGTISRYYEDHISFTTRDLSYQTHNLLPLEEAMIRVLESDDYEARPPIDFLGDRFYGIPTVRAPVDEAARFFELEQLGECHPTWTVYKSAARFLRNPSKETLAEELQAIASAVGPELPGRKIPWYSQIPWPMAACLNMSSGASDILDLARRVASGDLGDRGDWLKAEDRWTRVGITEEDISGMTDDRLPFDSLIATSGFPTTLSVWPVLSPYSDRVVSFQKLINLHPQIISHRFRSFVAALIEVCFIGESMFFDSDEPRNLPEIKIDDLRSIYEDLPPGRSAPLHSIINRLEGSSEDTAQFFGLLKQRNVSLTTYGFRRIIREEGLERLRGALLNASDGRLLVPIFGLLAEYGQLPGGFVNVPKPQASEGIEEMLASLIILLANTAWEVDRTELLIDSIREIGKHGPMDGVYERIMNTLEHSRPSGGYFEMFLMEFGEILPTDDFKLHKRYMRLLQNALRRRTSRFADPVARPDFNLPKGITELL